MNDNNAGCGRKPVKRRKRKRKPISEQEFWKRVFWFDIAVLAIQLALLVAWIVLKLRS